MHADDDQPALDISSAANPRVKWLVSLRKRRVREAQGVAVVEGRDELVVALDAGVRPTAVFYCPGLGDSSARTQLLSRLRDLGAEIVSLSGAAFAKASYRESPDGWLAVVATPASSLDWLNLGPQALLLVCESIEKPGNLGAMLRTAEAVGADAVIAASPVSDWANPNVVRASKGAVFAVPLAAGSTSDVLEWLRRQEVHIVVTTPQADDVVSDLDLTGPTAIVVGAEHAGLTDAWFEQADATAKLPMSGQVNSLNVSTTAAVCLYEAIRQRAVARAGEGSTR
ncbi:MAG: RNA methyltransferase [Nocardioidaceae bacterium]